VHKIGYFSPLGYIALGYAIADRKSFIVDTINDEMVHDNHLMIAIFPYTITELFLTVHSDERSNYYPVPKGEGR